MARFGLSSRDASVRLAAARDIERDLDEANVAALARAQSRGDRPGVKKELATGLALAALDGSDAQARLDAIATPREQPPPGCAQPAGALAR